MSHFHCPCPCLRLCPLSNVSLGRVKRWICFQVLLFLPTQCLFFVRRAKTNSSVHQTCAALLAQVVPKFFMQLVLLCIWTVLFDFAISFVSDSGNKTGNSVDSCVCSSQASTSCSNASVVVNRLWFDVKRCLMSAGAILFRYSDFSVPSLSSSPVLVVYSRAFLSQSLILTSRKEVRS